MSESVLLRDRFQANSKVASDVKRSSLEIVEKFNQIYRGSQDVSPE